MSEFLEEFEKTLNQYNWEKWRHTNIYTYIELFESDVAEIKSCCRDILDKNLPEDSGWWAKKKCIDLAILSSLLYKHLSDDPTSN